MIDLTVIRKAIDDAKELAEDLDGLDLDDSDAISTSNSKSRSKAEARAEKAQASKDLLLLADRLGAASYLCRDAYWKFKGEFSIIDQDDQP